MGEGDSAAITAAVSALLYVALGRRRLVWGGHPAITPMVWSVAEAMNVDYSGWVRLYQTLAFKDDFPEETAKFQNVVFTEAVGSDIPLSLEVMRKKMIGDTSFDVAVFIGGMAGIMEEYELIRASACPVKIIPLASTGGAALSLHQQVQADPELEEELDYVSLFHKQLEIDPNERRYRTPSEQPVEIADRITVPFSRE
ncbi:hypothetical protein G7076_03000 [Sphingomonas sp. HDW15A]|nr:hypothetical protein G7076_03000 [Sphingomonas sp. HDW15A]